MKQQEIKKSSNDNFNLTLNKIEELAQKCFHESCQNCHGTGKKENGSGMCLHWIHCPCPKCTPRC